MDFPSLSTQQIKSDIACASIGKISSKNNEDIAIKFISSMKNVKDIKEKSSLIQEGASILRIQNIEQLLKINDDTLSTFESDTWKGLDEALINDLQKNIKFPYNSQEISLNKSYEEKILNIKEGLGNDSISMKEYKEKIESIFKDNQILQIPIKWLKKILHLELVLPKVDIYQDKKDIKRDSIIINGVLHKGQIEGYEAIVSSLHDTLLEQESMTNNNEKRKLIIKEERSNQIASFASEIMSASNRTESGGDAYDALDYLTSNPNLTILRPNSDLSEGIKVDISVGPFVLEESVNNFSWGWGLRAKISGSTFYLLCNSGDPSDVLKKVSCTNHKLLALGVGYGESGGKRRDFGVVDIKMT